jgi:tetratricopeptide (TPR) repeat protein
MEAILFLGLSETAYHNDPIWLYLDGEVKLGLGWYDNARADFTRVLAARPDLIEAYLGRGLADAHLGRLARYEADLAAAGELNQERAKAFKALHAAEVAALQAAMPGQKPQDLAADLLKKALANEPTAALVAGAKALELSANAIRRYGDEQYQDGLRKLQNQVIADPKSSVRWGELAKYVYLEARVRTVWNGRGNKLQDLRNQDQDQYLRERQLAMQYADKALELDPRNVDAIGTKGWLTLMNEDPTTAMKLAEQGLAIQPYYPRLAKLKSTVLSLQSDNAWYEAQKLRAPRTFNGPGWWVTISPSEAELQQARQYDQLSSQITSQANEQSRQAFEKYSATLSGLLLKGDYYAWVGDFPASIAAYEEVLKVEPENVQALEALYDTYSESVENPGKALFYEVKYVNTQQTTAAPWLNVAWEHIVATRWRSAEQSLDQAALLDPADSRIFAYRAVVATNQKKFAEAAAYWRIVLAMEEARMNLDGQTLLASQGGGAPLTQQGSNMALQALGHLAKVETALGRQQDAQSDQGLYKAIMARATLVSLRTDLPFSGLPVPGNLAAGDPGPFGRAYETPDRAQYMR